MAVDLGRPRIVMVTRKTPLELLLELHGTRAQARFYLESRGQDLRDCEEAHERSAAALAAVHQELPPDQRRVVVERGDLDRFLFAPEDVILVVGQDGLVPNVAKYLRGQVAVGVNPDPSRYDGVLCQHPAGALPAILRFVESGTGDFRLEHRAMAVAEREDGQRLLALNEVFIGHRSHQSARYTIRAGARSERQSSSGLICATGTGCTGWVRSIVGQRRLEAALPAPGERRLAWFVREPFPSVATGTSIDWGYLGADERLELVSLMGEGGVIFADGIEGDYVAFLEGQSVRLRVAEETLNLVVRQ